jgi:hypothetical protein
VGGHLNNDTELQTIEEENLNELKNQKLVLYDG